MNQKEGTIVVYNKTFMVISNWKNTVQALKYPSAHAVTLYMPGFKAIIRKWERFIKID